MKKFLLLILSAFFYSCEVNYASPSLLKLKYCNNINLTNSSSYEIQYKYAPGYRKDVMELDCMQGFIGKMSAVSIPINVAGHLKPGEKRLLYTGVDTGAFYSGYIVFGFQKIPNFNVEGLPSRFVIMIDDSIVYSLVYDCKYKNEEVDLVIDDQLINRLKAIKPENYQEGYNYKRDCFGKSVKVGDRLYCFEQYDSGKSSLWDYTYIEKHKIENLFAHKIEGLYGRIWFYNFIDFSHLTLYFYDDDNGKSYVVGQGTNPTIEEVK